MGTLAERICAAQGAIGELEEAIHRIVGDVTLCVEFIFYFKDDNSLEFAFRWAPSPEDKISPEQGKAILELGFSKFTVKWPNYTDQEGYWNEDKTECICGDRNPIKGDYN